MRGVGVKRVVKGRGGGWKEGGGGKEEGGRGKGEYRGG